MKGWIWKKPKDITDVVITFTDQTTDMTAAQ